MKNDDFNLSTDLSGNDSTPRVLPRQLPSRNGRHRPQTGLATSPVFLVRNLEKSFPEYQLKIDELEIFPGLVALLGVSGAGKSTLLRMLANLDPDYRGEIQYLASGGVDDERLLRRNHFSFAFQKPNLLSNFRVHENIAMACQLAGIDGDDLELTLARLFPEFESQDERLQQLLHRYPSELSVGQRQRVAAARAIFKAKNGAEVLIADEPTANLDPVSASHVFNELKNWQEQDPQRVVLLATHDLSLARKSDRVIALGFEDRVGEQSQFSVAINGETDDCWTEVQSLLEGNSLTDDPLESFGPVDDEPTVERASKHRSSRRTAGLFFRYFYRDVTRGRDLAGSAVRCFVVGMLILVLAICTLMLDGAPKLAELVLKKDRLLRILQVESTGQFPVSPKKMNLLASLGEAGGEISSIDDAPNASPLFSGVVPKREMPLRLCKADGTVFPQWIDNVQLAYPDHPELTKTDPLFDFWGLPSLNRTAGIFISPKLLTKLGYDPQAVQRALQEEGTFVLHGEERLWKFSLPVEQVVDFPDDQVDIIIPSLLGNKIQNLSQDVIETRFNRIGFGPVKQQDFDESKLQDVESELKQLFVDKTTIVESMSLSIAKSLDKPDELMLWLDIQSKRGISDESVNQQADALSDLIAPNLRFEFCNRVLPGTTVDREAGASANQISLYVNDFNKVPKIIDYLEAQRPSLKLRVLNAKNREFIRTAQLAVTFTKTGVAVVGILFAIACLFGLWNSFATMLRRKTSEIAVLLAFGARRMFVLLRFVLEAMVVCIVAAAVALLFVERLVVPHLNTAITRFFPDASGTEPVFELGSQNILIVLGFVLVTAVFLALAVVPYLFTNTARLLSLSE